MRSSQLFSSTDLDEFAIRFIRTKVRELIGRAGITESDRDDLYQDFALDLIQRRRKFDPAKATWEGFVVVVVSNYCAQVLKSRGAQMRSFEREAGSLDAACNGEHLLTGPSIVESQQARRVGSRRSRREMSELAQDIAVVLDQMPRRKRAMCELMKHESKATVARMLGIPQGTFYEELRRIRTQFENASLNEYEL